MGHIAVFIARSDSASTLEQVASEVVAAIGVAEHQERFSSNYPPDDHYFVGPLEDRMVKVFELDDVKTGYPYCVSLENSSELQPPHDPSN